MTLGNTTRSWGAVTKSLHWLIVVLIISQWAIAQYADSLPLVNKGPPLNLHKSIGMTIFALAIFRLVWRVTHPVPSLEGLARTWERTLARISHALLYGLLLAMPLTGWLMSSARNFPVSWFGLLQFPDLVSPSRTLYQRMNDLHETLFGVLVVIAMLHVAGALKHHFIDRNEVLRRMLPFGGIK
jgi:cytochrome b561